MTLRTATLLILPFALGIAIAGCGGGSSSRLQTTDLPYTVARIKPSIDAAQTSNSGLFSIFPSTVAVRACRIPRGGPVSKVMTLPGTCATSLTYSRSGGAIVSFTERWHEPNKNSRWWQHTWRVIVNTEGEVVATRSLGAAAPQLWS